MADKKFEYEIKLTDNTKQGLQTFQQNTQKAATSAKTLNDKLGDVLTVGAFTAAIYGAGKVLGGFIKSANDSDAAIAQLNAVLASTGGVAGMTSEELQKMASALQNTTTFSDEAVMSAENLLLTFTSIGKDIFPQALNTVLDMSTALGQDLKSSSTQLGKALQDPILGVTALRRVGVNFNETQIKTIEGLVKAGKAMEAQKLILAELSKEFGGSAAAKAATFAGQIEILKNKFDDLKEGIGKTLQEAFSPAVGEFGTLAEQLAGDTQEVQALGHVLGVLAKVAVTTAQAVHSGLRVITQPFKMLGTNAAWAWGQITAKDTAERAIYNKVWEEQNKDQTQSMMEELAKTQESFDKMWLQDSPKIDTKRNVVAPKGGFNPYADLQEEISKTKTEAEKKAEELAKTLKGMGEKYVDTFKKSAKSFYEFEEDNQKAVDAIVEDINKLNDSLKELKESYEKTFAGLNQDMGTAVFDQTKKIEDLKKELEEKKHELFKERQDVGSGEKTEKMEKEIEDLKKQLAQEQKALEEFNKKGLDLTNEIAEAKRRDSETEFERIIEDTQKKKSEAEAEYEEKKALMEQEKKDKEYALSEKKKLYEAEKAEFNKLVASHGLGMDVMAIKAEATATAMQESYGKIKAQLDEIRAITAPEDGEDTRTDAQVFAQTGVSNPYPQGMSPFEPTKETTSIADRVAGMMNKAGSTSTGLYGTTGTATTKSKANATPTINVSFNNNAFDTKANSEKTTQKVANALARTLRNSRRVGISSN